MATRDHLLRTAALAWSPSDGAITGDWANISGKRGERIVFARTLGGRAAARALSLRSNFDA